MAQRRNEWRLVVKLKSRTVLLEYMKFKGLSVKGLADEAKLSKATVGHLASGFRSSCSIATAGRIEEALGCPPRLLFEPTMSRVADAPRPSRKVAA